MDAYGQVLNAYTGHRRVQGTEPDRPWAVYLAGPDRRFRLLCFDLDAKTTGAAAAAEQDAGVLTDLLGEVGLGVVVCRSGPGGGRHVWTALAEGVEAETVATLARLARHLCPTLDLSPLTNAGTGCVRPPGAPHRSGGHSHVLHGDLGTLTTPTGTANQVDQLVENLARLVVDTGPGQGHDLDTPLPVDEHARLYLPGPRRELPAVSAAALGEDAAAGDASAILWRVLLGAAAARWRHGDIAALVETAPGLEHVRTCRDRARRTPRSRVEAAQVLRRQWDKAVRHVATSARQVGHDPTFDARADAITAHARAVQTRADACAGRWTRPGGPADRRVLDALCVLALQALTPSVEADIRRLALLTGIGRETARTALLRLAGEGWITQARPAQGPHAAHWILDSQVVIPTPLEQGRSQADPRAPGVGSAERHVLLATLTTRMRDAAHDLFTPGPGLGHHAGNLYARTGFDPHTLDDLDHTATATTTRAAHLLEDLKALGVLVQTRAGWHRPAADHRRAAAALLGVDGRLSERARRYGLERELWAWWRAEHAWMCTPGRPGRTHRPGRHQLCLLPAPGTHAYGPHPRRAGGRLDWRQARRIVEDERAGLARRTPTRARTPAARPA